MRDVSVKLPSSREELDGYVDRFDEWFRKASIERGWEGAPLMSIERNILFTFITWLRDHEGEADAADQAQREV